MTTLLLLALPWGYLIAAAFLLLAIILFVVAIFMKDTGEQEEVEHGYTQERENAYESDFDRYPVMTTEVDSEEKEDLKEMIAEPTEDFGETKMFIPVVDIPEPELEPFEESFEEPEEALFESPVVADFEEIVEPEEDPVEEIPEVEEIDEDADVKRVDADEFDEELVLPERKRFGRSRSGDSDEDDVPKPAPKGKSGMSFAEEVRRLIEEEEKRNQNS